MNVDTSVITEGVPSAAHPNAVTAAARGAGARRTRLRGGSRAVTCRWEQRADTEQSAEPGDPPRSRHSEPAHHGAQTVHRKRNQQAPRRLAARRGPRAPSPAFSPTTLPGVSHLVVCRPWCSAVALFASLSYAVLLFVGEMARLGAFAEGVPIRGTPPFITSIHLYGTNISLSPLSPICY